MSTANGSHRSTNPCSRTGPGSADRVITDQWQSVAPLRNAASRKIAIPNMAKLDPAERAVSLRAPCRSDSFRTGPTWMGCVWRRNTPTTIFLVCLARHSKCIREVAEKILILDLFFFDSIFRMLHLASHSDKKYNTHKTRNEREFCDRRSGQPARVHTNTHAYTISKEL